MILIEHTHEHGTTLTGSSKGDGVLEIVTDYGFTWRHYAGIHIRGSRDTWSWRHRINEAADALRAAGHEVTVDIDDTWRPAAVREQERGERAEARQERLSEWAGNASARSAAARAAADRIGDGIPMGQPILLGHHSQRRAERDRDRMIAGTRKAIAESDKANDLAARADGSARNEAAKHNPRAIMRRIETLETEVRRFGRRRDEAGQVGRARYTAMIDRHEEEIAYLRGKLDAHAESGAFVAWGPDNIAKGDEVKVMGRWFPVLRVNKKSVTVPWRLTFMDGRWSPGDSTDRIGWDDVHGRRRDGAQHNRPNGPAIPVKLAKAAATWAVLLGYVGRDVHRLDDDQRRVQRLALIALRLAYGLPADASDAELSVRQDARDFTDRGDVDAETAQYLDAAALLGIFRQLKDGAKPDEVAAGITPFRVVGPAWEMPAGTPTRQRVDLLAPGDIVAGDYGYGGENVVDNGFVGPVAEVSPVRDRRESGSWVTVTLAGGESREFKTHRWLPTHLAGGPQATARHAGPVAGEPEHIRVWPGSEGWVWECVADGCGEWSGGVVDEPAAWRAGRTHAPHCRASAPEPAKPGVTVPVRDLAGTEYVTVADFRGVSWTGYLTARPRTDARNVGYALAMAANRDGFNGWRSLVNVTAHAEATVLVAPGDSLAEGLPVPAPRSLDGAGDESVPLGRLALSRPEGSLF